MAFYNDSNLPKFVTLQQTPVPAFTSTGDPNMQVTTTLTDLSDISFFNANSVSLNVTVTDGGNLAVANLSSYPIDPNTPYDFQFRVPIRLISGLKIYANSVGLAYSLRAHRHPGYTAQ